MKEKTKLVLGGIWVVMVTITSVWLLSLFRDEYYYGVVTLVWCFAWLGAWQFHSWMIWAEDVKKRNVKRRKGETGGSC